MNALEIINLTKNYKGFTLNNVSFALPEGCIMGLIGENGAGKTTTIKLILDMIRSDGGSVEVFGRSNKENFVEAKQHIGVVMGEPGLSGCLKPKDVNGIMGGIFTNWEEDSFYRLLGDLDVPLDKKYKDMSQGTKMKLGIAIALSHGARLLILDEPTNGLDPLARDKVMEMLMEFTRREDRSVLISSHIVSDLEKVCDYIGFIHKGDLMLCEGKDELLSEYAMIHCRAEDLGNLEPGAVIAVKNGSYGAEAVIRRRAVPEAMKTSPLNLEELFVVMAKEG